MATVKEYLLTPAGRIVQGDLWNRQTRDGDGNTYENPDDGPYFFALAVRKDDPEWPNFWNAVYQFGARNRPDAYQKQNFSWKILDGDNSPAYQGKEGCAGCYIIRLNSGFAPQIVAKNINTGKCEALTHADQCKRGDYAQVQISMAANDSERNPGIYLNHAMVLRIGYGEPINTGPNPDEVFTDNIQLPPGASSTPIAGVTPPAAPGGAPAAPGGAPAAPGGAPAAPGGAPAAPGGAPAAPGGAPAAPGGAPAAPGGAPAAPGGAPAAPGGAPAAPEPHTAILNPQQSFMTPAAGEWTYDQYIAAGWTDEKLIAAGFMAHNTGTDVPF